MKPWDMNYDDLSLLEREIKSMVTAAKETGETVGAEIYIGNDDGNVLGKIRFRATPHSTSSEILVECVKAYQRIVIAVIYEPRVVFSSGSDARGSTIH